MLNDKLLAGSVGAAGLEKWLAPNSRLVDYRQRHAIRKLSLSYKPRGLARETKEFGISFKS
jgi:hypothetical protein